MSLINPSARSQVEVIRDNGRLRLFGYRYYLRRPWSKGSALLCLLPEPVLADMEGEEIIRFSNSGFGLAWARVLNEMGYVLDVVNWDDTDFVPAREYDLVVFHGAKTFPNVYKNLKNSPKIIHFLSGSYWKFNNSKEDKRIKDFKRRHGITLERDRYIQDPEEPVNKVAKGIVVLGDKSMVSTYPKNLMILPINNASYPDSHFDNVSKDYGQARKNFLFFAGGGNIHKGLDLVIEAFADLEAEHLYVVTVLEKKFLSVFKKEFKRPNIHLIGEVGMRTQPFYDVMDKCAFVILPSCSEGQAGSVVEAMNQGLIPIVSKETRLNTNGYGFTLENNKISTIQNIVCQLANMKPERAEERAALTRHTAVSNHNPTKFRNDLKKHIKIILDS